MQKDDDWTIGGAGFGIADIQGAGIDLLQAANDVFVPGLILGNSTSFVLPDCASAKPIMPS